MSDMVLIRFDRKTMGYLGCLLFLLVLGTVFKLHGSSIGMWNRYQAGREPNTGILLGRPKPIRSDEWAVTTPAMISQAMARPSFPATESIWGPAQAPLIFNLPARHWSMVVRPQYWGFFVLDLERGFAFYWNMKTCLLLAGLFLLLMLLTANDFGLSLLGTGWVFFSGYLQWWYSNPSMLPETVGCFALVIVAAHYLALSESKLVLVASALLLSVSSLDFALSFYPPHQVVLFYLGITILFGSIGPRLSGGFPKSNPAFRITCAALAMSAITILLVLFYFDTRRAIDLMRSTVFPGSRISSGGELRLAQVFDGYYGFFMKESTYPRIWGNVCEASNFVLLFPVPMAVLLWRAWKSQKSTALEWCLMVYIVVILLWITIGWPHALAVASGFGLSPWTRPLLGMGLANIIFCIVFLSQNRTDLPKDFGLRLVVAGSFILLFVLFTLDFNRVTEGFATPSRVALVSTVAGAAGYLLLARRRIAFAFCILVPSVWSFGLVNPVAVGLGPILGTQTFQQVSRIVEQDPDARWTVYGSYVIANLVKATGARVFNGTNVVPPLDDLRVLDPDGLAASTYNRFAHIELTFPEGPQATFMLLQPDLYTIKSDPKSEFWHRLGIRYVALPIESDDATFLRMTTLMQALPDEGLWIYRYNWDIELRK